MNAKPIFNGYIAKQLLHKGNKIVGKPVVRISKDFSNITIFPNSRQAYYGLYGRFVTSSGINNCCNKKQKTAYGYYWMFYKDYIKYANNL